LPTFYLKALAATLLGEIEKTEKFHILGFVPIDIVDLKEIIWSRKLEVERINAVEEYFSRPRTYKRALVGTLD
jgi:hypothetical protein